MIGNDIVDLDDPETDVGASHPRFEQRVFSVAEHARIACSRAPREERWALWAAKEATYKLVRASDPSTVFSPSQFEVRRLSPSCAEVRWHGRRVSVELDVRPESIHAVAKTGAHRAIVSGLAPCHGGDPSRSVRALAIETLSPHLGTAPGSLRIDRERGCAPVLVHENQPTEAVLSLSHHGRFVAFACELPPGAGWGQ